MKTDIMEVHTDYPRWSRRNKKHSMEAWRRILTLLTCKSVLDRGGRVRYNTVRRYVECRTGFRIVPKYAPVAPGSTAVNTQVDNTYIVATMALSEPSSVVAAPANAVAFQSPRLAAPLVPKPPKAA